ncbi:hypothetical protein BTUL_0260g00030 [Botrytis tulipae]|uniref:Uncharacterized protein n=1 Tax=Botrytis tulipae TaxID=87230 RepID=A0A4Z1EA02_9HELO|nr:hypothetical protein BTUL_0260g00030 [Botrytis tulipae]
MFVKEFDVICTKPMVSYIVTSLTLYMDRKYIRYTTYLYAYMTLRLATAVEASSLRSIGERKG